MAFLMLLHEKMRLQRKVNKLTLQELRLSSRKERITKNISRVQKMYSSKMSQLEKHAQLMQSQATIFFQNQMGLGTQNQAFNPANLSGGVTSFVLNNAKSLFEGGVPIGEKDENGKPTNIKFENGTYEKLLQEYSAGTLKAAYESDGTTLKKDSDGKQMYGANGDISENEYKAFMMSMNQAQNNQSQAQAMCSQMSSQYQSNMSIWLEAEKARLESEQDMALAPLEMKETEMDLDKESCEAQLADAKARLESIKQACSEGIKDSAPTFGLG